MIASSASLSVTSEYQVHQFRVMRESVTCSEGWVRLRLGFYAAKAGVDVALDALSKVRAVEEEGGAGYLPDRYRVRSCSLSSL